MEITMVPSQFLSVVLEEDNISECDEDVSNCPNQNTSGIDSVMDQEMWNLTKTLPKALLAECTVEISRTPINQNEKVKKPCFDAKVSPVFSSSHLTITPQRTNVGGQQYLPPPPQLLHRSEWIEERMDVQDLLTGVEAVYSDNESEGEYEETASVSIFPITINKTDKPKDKPKKQDLSKFSYPCEHCPNVYSNRGALWQHSVATHSVEKTCECKICGRKFYRNCSLALHLKSHSEEEYCQCKECGKSFNRLANLERHMRVHTEAEQFPCPHCDKIFREKTNLQRHIATHNSARSKQSKGQDHLLQTPQTLAPTETSIGCSTCGDIFTSFAELMQHDATHATEKSHSGSQLVTNKNTPQKHTDYSGERLTCTTCGLDFTQKSSLLRHVKRMHPQEIINIDPTLFLDDKSSGLGDDASSENGSLQDTEPEGENDPGSLSNIEIRRVLDSPVKSEHSAMACSVKVSNTNNSNFHNTKNEKALSSLDNYVDNDKCTQLKSLKANGVSVSIETSDDVISNKNGSNLGLSQSSDNASISVFSESNSGGINETLLIAKQHSFKTEVTDPLTSVDINTMHASSLKLENITA